MTRAARRLIWIGSAFLIISTLTRVGLALLCDERFGPAEWGRFMGRGFLFDIAVLPWFLLPWVLWEAVVPDFHPAGRAARWEGIWAALWAGGFFGLFIAIAAAETAFWIEFGSRFDFIAVDYLVYTHEVIGNIQESYPVIPALTGLALVSGAVVWWTWPRVHGGVAAAGWRGRLVRAGAVALAATLGLFLVDIRLAETKASAFVQQLSENGVYAFFHAYNNNQLDYDKYYPALAQSQLNAEIRQLVTQPGASFTGAEGIERRIAAHGPKRDVNVVLISVESLSAEFLGRFGNSLGLTPELDRLAGQGLQFTQLYATGTRTVRGLEALSIGTPPTPGQSIVRRPGNTGLENLGEELAENGWNALWIYGGYGVFDNMNAYFGANGYDVIDRTDAAAEKLPIHGENIWGIADEDLFSLAINHFDKEYAAGRHFFAHVMTTSNHRPYTFPAGRVDLPTGRREGAVKYTDWALGDFINRADAKPWFEDTLFIISADHTAKAAGKTDLPPSRYHIPMIWYAPKLVPPGTMDRMMSQMDIGPTLLGWLGLGYSSRFFGYDMFTLEAGRERAFISTYQKLGYLKAGRLVTLDVKRPPKVSAGQATGGDAPPVSDAADRRLIDEAIAWYQAASLYFRQGSLKDVADGDGPANPGQASPAGH